MNVAHNLTTVPGLTAALAEVTEERDHYMRELGISRDHEAEGRVQSRLGLTTKEAALLMILHRRAGRVVTKEGLMEAMYNGMDEPEVKIIDVFVCKLRRKIGMDAVDTIWGRGYRITEAGVALVEQAMMVAQ